MGWAGKFVPGHYRPEMDLPTSIIGGYKQARIDLLAILDFIVVRCEEAALGSLPLVFVVVVVPIACSRPDGLWARGA